MDMAGKDTNMSSEWQVDGMIPMVESSACSSGPMADSFCPPIWDQPINGHRLGYSDVNVQNDAATSSGLGLRADMAWTQMFLPAVPAMLQQALPQFPADSGFIERAARFSCFNGGNFGEAMNPFSSLDPLHPYTGLMQGPHEVSSGNTSSPLLKNDETLFKNEKKIENLFCSNGEAKQGNGGSGNEFDEAEFSGRESSGKGIGSKKRKRGRQNSQPDENNEATTQTSTETAQKGDENPTSVNRPGDKNGKQGSQGSEPPKEDYMHIRARRGQATNSHSLAERVRREKISERMKYLQDLVPGCNKVTGKAVMLDEIINYVQSLQRQVEFLSMKLATVNPRLDFNIEGFLAKDILQPGASMPSSLAFPPDITMPFLPLHPSHAGLVRTSHPGNSSVTLRRPTNLQSTAICRIFKEPASQVQSVWEDELHNVVHMGFNTSPPLNSQDLSGSISPGHMKAET